MPYPMPYALAFPDDGYAPIHVPVHKGYEHKGYEEPLGRVKMQVRAEQIQFFFKFPVTFAVI